ncbi:DUF5667 domain-containing protein [Amycolatopsis saalfeldensis]|uniref:DUF5667 domain-containing protein n=1 Tax=Amycolatopsis saalfeldensis TaxID=394193 RepID=A0A1H8XNA6_9PSEU|nr:DUF5667 domain-containing protein [Amycolatopsis saalfeldensis]SEP41460.1 hypothetical protein SAMN04489732_108153 [Amycolatopsis saalfeldensis]
MGVPGRFSRERVEVERFDRALDPPPGQPDDDFADELAVVAALRELGPAGRPDPATRERIRAEIEGRLGEPVVRRRWRPRMADLAAAGIALVLGLVGLTLLLSKNAVPGETLYDVKRAGEATSLAFTFGAEAKAQKHLEFAADRVAELGRMTDASPSAYRTALDDFGTDVRAGVTQLTALATSGSDHGQLTGLKAWAHDQSNLLAAEESRVPAAAALDLSGARGLLTRIQERTTALVSRLDCYEITTGSSDELGLLPAKGACTQQQPSRIGATPSPDPSSPPPPSSETVPPTTSAPRQPDLAIPTAPTPTPPPSGGTPPPVYAPPIPTPTAPRLPTPPSPPPPVLSFPPLLPGLPPIVIG